MKKSKKDIKDVTVVNSVELFRCNSIDGIRAFSAFGIVAMHVLVNGRYNLNGYVFDTIIPSFANLVFLFMVISGFSMCSGYYYKFINNKISIIDFYSKRYRKTLPYFTFLCILDFIISPNINSIYEIFANITLCFGLLPQYDISVIGVAWFLGLVFVFYFVFPFYCYLLSSKSKAWFSFFIAFIFNYLCIVKFNVGRNNIIYCGVYFILGGIIYLYHDEIEKINKKYSYIFLIIVILSLFSYYYFSTSTITMLFLFGSILIYSLLVDGKKYNLLECNLMNKISNISLEIYLSHMVVYRILERLKLLHLFEYELISYIFCVILDFGGTIVFSIVVRYLIKVFAIISKSWLEVCVNGKKRIWNR